MFHGPSTVLFAMSVTHNFLYVSTGKKNFIGKVDRSFILRITDSKAQSPVPGLEEPCLRLIPCFLPLKIALEIINVFFFFQ